SLNIKLECKSKEANKIKENEINQQKELEFKKNKINLSSIAMLCPILECDELRCIHGGQVLLKSNLGKSIKAKLKDDSIKDAPIMLESDLLYSPILNCPNSIAGIANPCTQIALILPSARGLKKYNEDYPIMQDLCMSGVFSDKGFAVICTKQENTLKINAPKPSNNNIDSKEAKKPNIKLTQPRLRLHYKEYDKQKDNVLIARFYLNDILQEKTQDEYFSNIELDFDKDTKDIENMLLKDKIAIDYPSKSYDLRQIDIMLGIHHLCLIFAIPTKIPKIFKKPYESYEYKEYGVGKYKALFVYNVDFENIKDSSDASDSNESSDDIVITHIRVFLAPAKAKKLDFVFAVGLDSWLENENICSFKIMADDVWYDSNIHNDD
ncbi:lipase, partial [Campylobacter troglodytis]